MRWRVANGIEFDGEGAEEGAEEGVLSRPRRLSWMIFALTNGVDVDDAADLVDGHVVLKFNGPI